MKQIWIIFLFIAGLLCAGNGAMAASAQITYRYDDLGRLAKALSADGHYVEYRYDAVGNFTTVTSGPDGNAERIGAYTQGSWCLDANNNGTWEPDSDFYGSFGTAAMTPVTGDWNGDGFTKLGAYINGTWFLDMNGNGFWDGEPTDRVVPNFGYPGVIPVTGDWNGDGVTEIGVYDPNTSAWYLDMNGSYAWEGTPADTVVPGFGFAGCLPVVGDWNGNGRDKIGVYYNGQWFLDTNGNSGWDGSPADTVVANFGFAGMLPVVGDWSASGVDRIGGYSNGEWYLDSDGNGAWNPAIDKHLGPFGTNVMVPVVGRW